MPISERAGALRNLLVEIGIAAPEVDKTMNAAGRYEPLLMALNYESNDDFLQTLADKCRAPYEPTVEMGAETKRLLASGETPWALTQAEATAKKSSRRGSPQPPLPVTLASGDSIAAAHARTSPPSPPSKAASQSQTTSADESSSPLAAGGSAVPAVEGRDGATGSETRTMSAAPATASESVGIASNIPAQVAAEGGLPTAAAVPLGVAATELTGASSTAAPLAPAAAVELPARPATAAAPSPPPQSAAAKPAPVSAAAPSPPPQSAAAKPAPVWARPSHAREASAAPSKKGDDAGAASAQAPSSSSGALESAPPPQAAAADSGAAPFKSEKAAEALQVEHPNAKRAQVPQPPSQPTPAPETRPTPSTPPSQSAPETPPPPSPPAVVATPPSPPLATPAEWRPPDTSGTGAGKGGQLVGRAARESHRRLQRAQERATRGGTPPGSAVGSRNPLPTLAASPPTVHTRLRLASNHQLTTL